MLQFFLLPLLPSLFLVVVEEVVVEEVGFCNGTFLQDDNAVYISPCTPMDFSLVYTRLQILPVFLA